MAAEKQQTINSFLKTFCLFPLLKEIRAKGLGLLLVIIIMTHVFNSLLNFDISAVFLQAGIIEGREILRNAPYPIYTR